MKVIIAGPDDDELGTHLESAGASVTRVNGIATRAALEESGVDEADLFVLTDANQATAIPIVRERTESVRIVVYARDSIPEFARPQAGLIVDPEAVGPDVVAEELLASD